MNNGDTIPTTGRLEVTTCWCGIQYAAPTDTMRWHRQSDKNAIYCPLGHAGVIRESDTTRLEASRARERHLEDQLKAAEADAEAVRVRLLRDRQRFANGVCPCCNRSFGNVARHMKSQHPDYNPADLTAGASVVFKCSCGARFETLRGLRIHQGHSRNSDWQNPSGWRWGRHLTEIGKT